MASTTSTPDATTASTLLFRVGGVLYGCDIREPQEIVPFRQPTRLPGAPAYVRGLINVRGVIVTVIDLAVRLDPAREPATGGTILLVRHRERLMGVIVDSVVDVRSLMLGDAPEGANRAITRGVATVDDGAIVVLDLGALISQVVLS